MRPVLVLFISILVVATGAYLVDTDLFDNVRTHYIKSAIRENQRDAELVENHINELRDKFANTLNEPAVRGSFLVNGDNFEGSRIFGALLKNTGGLHSIQLVDSNGVNLLYSTLELAEYRNNAENLPYYRVSVPAFGNAKFTMDDRNNRIIFSFPFYDSTDAYRGTALFSLSAEALTGTLKANNDVFVTGTPPGIVIGSAASKRANLKKVSSVWNDGLQDYITFDSENSGEKYALISAKTSQNLFLGRLTDDSEFSIPYSIRLILFLSMFLIFYMTLFFLVNLKPRPATLVRSRIKDLRADLFELLYLKKNSRERANWIMELEQRRDDIHKELKNNLKIKSRQEKDIDAIIDKAWDEMLADIRDYSSAAVPSAEELEELKAEETDKIEKFAKIEAEEAEEELEELEAVEEIAEAS